MKKDSTASVTKQKINSTFYPITKEELLWLRARTPMDNTTYVYLALKLENPFCDRPIDINVKEFILAWGIARSSLYKTLAKLEEMNVLTLISKECKIQWIQGSYADNKPEQSHDRTCNSLTQETKVSCTR
ncbi:hypothetical protein NIES4071_109890 (plasmid) [Calothrix sp. NIES-4071]|nr:hypothetical protein NIES4071_109890 [Calothrix sp. NIES-4071]BAZ65246.1 hypothetical protein NIES4105_109790 [Calothrix sp. NIES-4105]